MSRRRNTGMGRCGVLFFCGMACVTAVRGQELPQKSCTDLLVEGLLGTPPTTASVEARLDAPRTVPNAAEVVGSASGTNSANLANPVDFPRLAGAAVENGLVGAAGGTLTLQVTPFAWRALFDPKQMDQSNYDLPMNNFLRRIGGKATLGGKGEAFDRDGDGVVDDPQAANDLSDIVSYEISVRLGSSRDRRETDNFNEMKAAVDPRNFRDLRLRLREELSKKNDAWKKSSDLPGAGACPKLDTIANDQALAAVIADVKKEYAAISSATQKALKRIDGRPLWTVALGGVHRASEFGTDERYAAVRYSKGVEDDEPNGRSYSAELQYRTKDAFQPGLRDIREAKFDMTYQRQFGKSNFDDAPRGTLKLAAALERTFSAPAGLEKNIAQLGATYTIHLAKGISLPIAIAWANHASLLEDKRDVIGHVGISIDFDSLMPKSDE